MKYSLFVLYVAIFITCLTAPLTYCYQSRPQEKFFVVIIPSYNNIKWYQKNLDSVLQQQYSNFKVIYIDDASTDGMSDYVRAYIGSHPRGSMVEYIRNETRCGALCNIYNAVSRCNPNDIILLVDGDDWLANFEVLSCVNNVYQDSHVWMTYGQFIQTNGGPWRSSAVPDRIIANNQFRSYPWTTSHLRTFYAGLFQKINRNDLLYNGEFFSMTWDLAFMFPMLEMAGFHSRFIPTVLYIYNTENPISDCRTNFGLQKQFDLYIRSKPKYQPLVSLQ